MFVGVVVLPSGELLANKFKIPGLSCEYATLKPLMKDERSQDQVVGPLAMAEIDKVRKEILMNFRGEIAFLELFTRKGLHSDENIE